MSTGDKILIEEVISFLIVFIIIAIFVYLIFQERKPYTGQLCDEESKKNTNGVTRSKKKSSSGTSAINTDYARQFLKYTQRQIRKKEEKVSFQTSKLTKYEGYLEITLPKSPRLSKVTLITKTAKTPNILATRSTYYGTASKSSYRSNSSLLTFNFSLEGSVKISVYSETKFLYLRKRTRIKTNKEISGRQYYIGLPPKINDSFDAFSNDKRLSDKLLNDYYFVDLIQKASKSIDGVKFKSFSGSITVSIRFKNASMVDFNYAWSLFRQATRLCNRLSKTSELNITKESLFILPELTFSGKVLSKKEKKKTFMKPTAHIKGYTQTVRTPVSSLVINFPTTFSTSSLKAFEKLRYRVRSIQTKKDSIQIILYSGRINSFKIIAENGELTVIGKDKMRQPKDLIIDVIFSPQDQTSPFDFLKPWNQIEVNVTPKETKKVILSKTMLARAIAKYEGKFDLNISASVEPSDLSVTLTFTETEKNILLTLAVLKEINWMIDYI